MSSDTVPSLSERDEEVTQQPLGSIHEACQAQMQQFKERRQSDTRFCHELLRRAFDEQDPDAFDIIFLLFGSRMRLWLQTSPCSHIVEDVIQESFLRLWQQSQSQTFVVAAYQFPQVLWFLKRSTLIVCKETQQRTTTTTELDMEIAAPDTPDQAALIQAEIQEALSKLRALLSPEDYALLEQRFLHDQPIDHTTPHRLHMAAFRVLIQQKVTPDEWELLEMRHIKRLPPREIAKQHNEPVEQIYLQLATLRRRLVKDPDLKAILVFDKEV